LAGLTYEIRQSLAEAEDSVSDRLGKLLHSAEKGAGLDESLAPVADSLRGAVGSVDEAGRMLIDYAQKLDEDPAALDPIEDRLAAISDLKRKYRREEAGLLALFEELQGRLGEMENFDRLLEDSESHKSKLQERLRSLVSELSRKRSAAAKRLSTKLLASLKELALPQAQLRFSLEAIADVAEYREDGGDRFSLFVSFNPGEELRPFAEIISGGELSRLLLAFYEMVFPADEVGTFIFDEVDAGVGGKVAELIGRKLEALSRKTQVLCVTHLPQIACHAARHYTVEKSVRQGRTFSEIRLLKPEEREHEIARMLAGVEVTAQALKHARELLKNAAA
jgi:DNA repair protein RecN (Recombination protein N)